MGAGRTCQQRRKAVWLGRRLEQVRDRDGQAAEPLAGGVVDSVDDGGCHANRRDLAEALDAERIQQRVGLVDEVDLDLADVGVDRHRVFLEGGVEEAALKETACRSSHRAI